MLCGAAGKPLACCQQLPQERLPHPIAEEHESNTFIAEAASPEVDSMTGVGGWTQEETDKFYEEVRRQVKFEKNQALQMPESETVVTDTVCNFYGLEEQVEELHVLPGEEPEHYEVEVTLATGASAHAADRVDFPGYTM